MKLFFDLDGTLVDVKDKLYNIYNYLISEYGKKSDILNVDEYWKLKKSALTKRSIISRNLDEKNIQEYISRRKQMLEEKEWCYYDRLFDGVEDTLKNLSEQHTLYIVTLRKNRWRLLTQLEDFKILNYFHHVFNGENKSELIETYVDSQSVIIGDTEVEMDTAKKLNITSIAVSYGLRNEKFLSRYKPFYIINNITNLKL